MDIARALAPVLIWPLTRRHALESWRIGYATAIGRVDGFKEKPSTHLYRPSWGLRPEAQSGVRA
jgi:hypothetical protein